MTPVIPGPVPVVSPRVYGWRHLCFALALTALASAGVLGASYHWSSLHELPGLSLEPTHMGDMLARNGHLDAAGREYRMVLTIYPYYAPALLRLAETLSATGPLHEEVDVWTRLSERVPERTASWLGLGRALMKSGRLRESEASFARASDLDRSSVAALEGVGQVRLREGRATAAIESLTRALALAPNDPQLLASCGVAYAALGDFGEAVRLLVAAADRSGDPAIAENLRRVRAQRDRLAGPSPEGG